MEKEKKEEILSQLRDIFNIPLPIINKVCINCNWKVENIFDQLVLHSKGAIPKSQKNNNKTNTNMTASNEQRIVNHINDGNKILILMRGAPGSGKSTLAKSLISRTMPVQSFSDFVFSSDDYFYNSNGIYRYDVNRLSDAHAFNKKRVEDKAVKGWSPIIIDNTNMQLWEMMPYVQIGVKNGYIIEVLEPMTPWRISPGKLAQRNSHQVPKDKIERMLSKYEPGSAADLLKVSTQIYCTLYCLKIKI